MLSQNVRYALRTMLRDRSFFTVALLTLGLGIGANVTIFSLVSAVMLRPLPYPSPEQLVGLGQWRNQQGEGYIQTGVSEPNAEDIAQTGLFQQVAYFRWADLAITEGGHPESVDAIQASADLLPMFGVSPLKGRFLQPSEMEAGHDDVAVIGYRLWQSRYALNPNIVGQTVRLNERNYTIVGVMPSDFRFTWDQEMSVFVPLVLTAEERGEIGRATSRDLQTQARLKDGVSVARAQAGLNALAAALAEKYPSSDKGWGFKVEPLHAAYHRNMQTPLTIMLSAVTMVLLIACVNVANLLLARATGRGREMAVRVSVGASRTQLLNQLLTESGLLAICGGGLGLLFAWVGTHVLTAALARANIRFPNAQIISLDWRVVAYALCVTLLTALIFGLAPAFVTIKNALATALKESGAAVIGEGGRKGLRGALLVCEISLALILLTSAGLLVRSFVELSKVDLGIDPHNVLTASISLPTYKYASEGRQAQFFRDLIDKLAASPGVKAAGAGSHAGGVFFQPEGSEPNQPGKEPTAQLKVITPGYLDAEGTRLLFGRGFNLRDNASALPVALISESLAHRYFPNQNPLGRHLTLTAHVYSGSKKGLVQPLEVVGIVKDVRNESLWTPEVAIYVPFEQKPGPYAQIVLRTSLPPAAESGALRAAVLSLDPEQPVDRLRTMDEIVAESYGAIRFPMALLWIFSGLALLLAAIGIFGVTSYTVRRQTREIAIRMALGATGGNTLRLILRQGVPVIALGVLFGLLGALALGRALSTFLYGVTATDPLTFLAASAVLVLVMLLAGFLPARRAAHLDPAVALRHD